VLYGITRTDLVIVFGLDAGNVSHFGMVTKIVQVGVVIGSI